MCLQNLKRRHVQSSRPYSRVYILGYGYIGTRTDTTQQSGQTPDKEVEIKNVTIYVSGYTETYTTGMLSLPTVWRFSVVADINRKVFFYFYFLIWSLSRLLCCVGPGFNVAAALCLADQPRLTETYLLTFSMDQSPS